MITHVTVYSPEGNAEKHLRLNAVDLVRHCGYTYKPGRVYAPTDAPAYAMVAKAPSESAAQEVLNRHGHRSGAEADPAVAYAVEPEVVFDAARYADAAAAPASSYVPPKTAPVVAPVAAPVVEAAPEAVVEADEPEVTEEEAAPVAPARRGRPKKSGE